MSEMRWDLLKEGITPSCLALFLRCREQFHLHYVEGWRPKQIRDYKEFGVVFHNIQEQYRKERPTFEQITDVVNGYESRPKWKHITTKVKNELELTFGQVEVVADGYYDYWWNEDASKDWLGQEVDIKITEHFDGIGDVELRGRIDAVYRHQKTGKLWILDTKTKSQIRTDLLLDMFSVDLQLSYYMYCLYHMMEEVPAGVILDCVRRPSMKLLQRETLPQHLDRLRADIQKRPEHYFVRLEAAFSKKEITSWRETLESYVREMWNWSQGTSPHFMNPGSLLFNNSKSDFFNAIVNNDYSDLYKVKRSRNESEKANKENFNRSGRGPAKHKTTTAKTKS